MKYVYKLPAFMSIAFAIIAAVFLLLSGKDGETIAYEVSAVIAISYLLGIVVKNITIKTVKEVLVRKYILEQQERIKNKKQKVAEHEFEAEI